MRTRLFALIALSVLAAPAARAQGFDGDWFGTVDCVARDVFDRGSTQARGSVVNDVLTLRFGQTSVSGRIVAAGPARLLRLEGSLARGGFATFDGVVVTPRQIHARGVVGETACNVNITPARAPAEAVAPEPPRAEPPRAEQPRFGRAVPPAPPADNIPPKPNTAPAPNAGAAGKFAAPAPPPPPERPRAGASIQAPQPIDRPVPGGSVTGLTPPPPPPTAQAPPPRVVPAAPPPAATPPAAANPQVADRLACALAGTCGPPGAAQTRP